MFIPNPDNKPEVNHLDCDNYNNYVDNLEWCTRAENEAHKYFIMAAETSKEISEKRE